MTVKTPEEEIQRWTTISYFMIALFIAALIPLIVLAVLYQQEKNDNATLRAKLKDCEEYESKFVTLYFSIGTTDAQT